MTVSHGEKRGWTARVASVVGAMKAHASRALPEPALPRSAAGMSALLVVQAAALIVCATVVKRAMLPFTSAPPLPPVPATTSMTRFGMTESVRREIFRELAEAEIQERQRAITQNTWNGHLWSRFDDLGYVQRARARDVASRHNVTLTQVYLVLDEGIRARWPGPDGQPLSPNIEPLQLRSE
jgi:hypothetical protein